MEKPAGSGKRFLIVGLGAIGASLILPACGSLDASPGANAAVDGGTSDGGTGRGGAGTGTGGSGNGVGGVHGSVTNGSSGCTFAPHPLENGSTGHIEVVLLGLIAGRVRRRPRAD